MTGGHQHNRFEQFFKFLVYSFFEGFQRMAKPKNSQENCVFFRITLQQVHKCSL